MNLQTNVIELSTTFRWFFLNIDFFFFSQLLNVSNLVQGWILEARESDKWTSHKV